MTALNDSRWRTGAGAPGVWWPDRPRGIRAAAACAVVCGLLLGGGPGLRGSSAAAIEETGAAAQPQERGLHGLLDEVLDVYVRDGLVYYRALRLERARLDRYVASLDVPAATLAGWEPMRQAAFWLNAYNALVLRTVIDQYPIRGRSSQYPPNSIRQISGAFERRTWRVAGETLTLDQIETMRLAAFDDPRMFFAIGRGAVGGGRLRSEAFEAARLEEQLSDVVADCVRRAICAAVNEATGILAVSPIISWREAMFVSAYAAAVGGRFAERSPLERAVIAFIEPRLYPSERAWLESDRFKTTYQEFDWRLNDLTGGAPR